MRSVQNILLLLLLVVLASSCSTFSRKTPRDPVVVIYHVKPGAEKAIEPLLARAWEIYMREGMAFSEPHVVVRIHEDGQHDRFIETFMWRGYFATEYSSEAVKAVLQQIESLCESRGGTLPVEFRSAEMFVPRIEESIKCPTNQMQ